MRIAELHSRTESRLRTFVDVHLSAPVPEMRGIPKNLFRYGNKTRGKGV
jgi:hypothetical protein